MKGVLTIASGRNIQQFTFGEESVKWMVSFSVSRYEGRLDSLNSADKENDQFWVTTVSSSILKISMKKKKVLQRVNLAKTHFGLTLAGNVWPAITVGKFLIGKHRHQLHLWRGLFRFTLTEAIVAFDTENGDLDSSSNGNVHCRVLLSGHTQGHFKHLATSNLASDGESLMFFAQLPGQSSFELHVFTAEEIESRYPRVSQEYCQIE